MLAAHLRSRGRVVAVWLPVVALAGAVAALAHLVDTATLARGLSRAATDPAGVALAVAAFFGAFALRALAWQRVLPGLGFGHSLAALHVALGANHVLPLRLGEPMRIVSARRRTGVGLGPLTASTVALRTADVLTLLVLGALAGPAIVWDVLGSWGPAAVVALAVVGAVAIGILVRQRAIDHRSVRLPGPLVLGATAGAWLAEALVVWQAARWFDVELTATAAVVVLAAAVSAQLVAIAPGGVGTYEAAAAAALVAVGVEPALAFTVAVGLHAVKTVYSLVGGTIALVHPAPGLLGRARLNLDVVRPRPSEPPGAGPVVLFLPAHDEAPRITGVIDRVPDTIDGHPVVVIVIDDGSTDGTAAAAIGAGATVVSHPRNLGLGAAVRTGLQAARERGAAAVAFCDADGEYDPAELSAIVGPILSGDHDYVVGNRFVGELGHMRRHRRLGNRVLTCWVRFLTRHPVDDGQSGYRALSGRATSEATIAHDYNYAQVLTVDLLLKGFGYHEVPISYTFRRSGRSFVRLGTYLRHVVPAVWRQLNPAPPHTAAAPPGVGDAQPARRSVDAPVSSLASASLTSST